MARTVSVIVTVFKLESSGPYLTKFKLGRLVCQHSLCSAPNLTSVKFATANTGVGDTVGVAVGATVAVTVGAAVAVGDGDGLGDGDKVGVGETVAVGVGLAVGVAVGVGLGDGLGDGVGVGALIIVVLTGPLQDEVLFKPSLAWTKK